MHSLFHPEDSEPPAPIEPVAIVFPSILGAEISALSVGTRIAGDFYDSFRVNAERVLIGLLNVSSLAETNRSILATGKQIFRDIGTQLFSNPDINEAEAMTELCVSLNRGLIQVSSGVHPCPAFIACYHERFGTLCYTNAGHTPALLRDAGGIAELGSTGLPLGLFSHATADAPTVGVEKCAALLLVSHGVVESEGYGQQSAEKYGLERVKTLLQSATASSAATLCSSILTSVAEFGGQRPSSLDRTALALLRTA